MAANAKARYKATPDVWHRHSDGKQMHLIPTDIHDAVRRLKQEIIKYFHQITFHLIQIYGCIACVVIKIETYTNKIQSKLHKFFAKENKATFCNIFLSNKANI